VGCGGGEFVGCAWVGVVTEVSKSSSSDKTAMGGSSVGENSSSSSMSGLLQATTAVVTNTTSITCTQPLFAIHFLLIRIVCRPLFYLLQIGRNTLPF
jgi:hypothetical protein